jgi:transposase
MALVMPTPSHAGSRSQAREMFSGHRFQEAPLGIVLVDCSRQIVGTPSFLDELIRIVLVDGEALGLLLDNASERIKTNAERCARNRGVQDRLQVVVRPPPRFRGRFRR